MKFIQIALLSFLLASGASLSVAQTKSNDKPMVIDAAVTSSRYQLYEGDVTNVDKKTRTITFKNKEGESKFVAGPEITNFPQIKKGDHLNVSYELGMAIELIKTKSTGDKPAEKITNTTTIIADIIGVDRDKKLVSVKGPSGKVTTVFVKNPSLLNDVAVGEQVKVIYTDAMAASITTPKK